MWDDETQEWTPTSLFDALQSITDAISVMKGATSQAAGMRGLVPDPPAGSQNFYLAGSGNWINPEFQIRQTVNNMASVWFGNDWSTQSNGIVNGQTVRDIASDEVAKIVAQAPAQFDTLKEIADWIKNQPTVQDITNLVSRVDTIETRVFVDVPPNPETGAAGQLSIVHQITNLTSNMTNMQQDITNIQNSLRWQDLTMESSGN